MSAGSFRKSLDASLLVARILKRLGCGDLNTFEGRLRTQKVQYFAQLFKVSPEYSYGLYLRGPYSPDLSHDLFEIKKQGMPVEDFSAFVSNELEDRFKRLKEYIKEKSTRELELASTLHWLINAAKLPPSKAREELKNLKGATSEEFNLALKNIAAI